MATTALENCGTSTFVALTFVRMTTRVGALEVKIAMADSFFHLTTIAVIAVFAALGAGLWNMSREGTASTGQKLMRWRVGLQFLAIVVIMLAIWFKRASAG